jgi:hypothetical protein
MDLYYNFFVLDPLGDELRTKINTNTLKTILLLFVYSRFPSFVASFQYIKLPKYTNIFWMMSLFIYIIIIISLNVYDMNCVERLTQIH